MNKIFYTGSISVGLMIFSVGACDKNRSENVSEEVNALQKNANEVAQKAQNEANEKIENAQKDLNEKVRDVKEEVRDERVEYVKNAREKYDDLTKRLNSVRENVAKGKYTKSARAQMERSLGDLKQSADNLHNNVEDMSKSADNDLEKAKQNLDMHFDAFTKDLEKLEKK